MKQLTVKTGIVAVLLSFALFCNAQLVVPFDLRNQYVVKSYQLSPEQLNDYEKVLGDILGKWDEIKNRKCSPSERKAAEQKLQSEFCAKVRAVFPDKQYVLWNRNHRGNLTVRFYKEDLGMDNEQFSKFRDLTNDYSKQKRKISEMNLLEAERSEQRTKALNQYSERLHEIFSKEIADYLVYENQILNKATVLSKNYTILSPNKAVRFAILKTTYEEDKSKLETQGLAPKQLRKEKKKLESKYEDSLHGLLTNEEYLACSKSRDKLTDKKFAEEYNLSDEQLSKYKQLRKDLAMKELVIKQNKKDKNNKGAKLKTARNEFEKEMEKLLGTGQYKRWKENESLKSKKKH